MISEGWCGLLLDKWAGPNAKCQLKGELILN